MKTNEELFKFEQTRKDSDIGLCTSEKVWFMRACEIKDKEIEKLKDELKTYSLVALGECPKIIGVLKEEIQKLKTELEAEKKVVDFYGNQDNYNDSNYANEFELTSDMYSEEYKQFSAGKLARQRIKERNK
jgi:hypothetical protein